VRYAADADETELHRRLAVAVCSLAATQRAYEDWRDCATQALTAAREAGDRLGEAALLYSLGALDEEQGREDEARARLRGALGAFEQLGADAWCELAAEALERLDHAARPAAGYPARPAGRTPGRPGVTPVAGQPRWTQGQFGKAARGYDGAQPRTAGAAGGWGGTARHRPVAPSGPFPNRHRNDPMEDR
jgi:tetratricopeptide (TPR) repeat protein